MYLKKIEAVVGRVRKTNKQTNNRKATYYPSTFYKGKVEDEEFEP